MANISSSLGGMVKIDCKVRKYKDIWETYNLEYWLPSAEYIDDIFNQFIRSMGKLSYTVEHLTVEMKSKVLEKLRGTVSSKYVPAFKYEYTDVVLKISVKLL
jgi:hypothetical protein